MIFASNLGYLKIEVKNQQVLQSEKFDPAVEPFQENPGLVIDFAKPPGSRVFSPATGTNPVVLHWNGYWKICVANVCGSGRMPGLSCLSGMTEEKTLRCVSAKRPLFYLSHKNAVCHPESATLSSADISRHAWLCIAEHSLFPTQHYKFPDRDIFAVDRTRTCTKPTWNSPGAGTGKRVVHRSTTRSSNSWRLLHQNPELLRPPDEY